MKSIYGCEEQMIAILRIFRSGDICDFGVCIWVWLLSTKLT